MTLKCDQHKELKPWIASLTGAIADAVPSREQYDLEFVEPGPLGIKYILGKNSEGDEVARVATDPRPGSQAAAHPQLRGGLYLIAVGADVGEKQVSQMLYKEIIDAIKGHPQRPLVLRFSNMLPRSEPPPEDDSSIAAAEAVVPVANRWLVTYNSDEVGEMPVAATPVKALTYSLEPNVKKAKKAKNIVVAHELTVSMLDGSTQKSLLASTSEDQAGYEHLIGLLEPDAAEVLSTGIIDGAKTKSKDEKDAETAEIDGEDVEGEDLSFLRNSTYELDSSGTDIADLFAVVPLKRLRMEIEQISLSLGIQTYSWMSVNCVQFTLDTATFEDGAVNIDARLHHIYIDDLYTRDSVFPHMLSRFTTTQQLKERKVNHVFFRHCLCS